MSTEFPAFLPLPDAPSAPPPPLVPVMPGRIGTALSRFLVHLEEQDHRGRTTIGEHLAQVAAFHQQQLHVDDSTAGGLR